MDNPFHELQKIAKQVIEADRLLAGDLLAPGKDISSPLMARDGKSGKAESGKEGRKIIIEPPKLRKMTPQAKKKQEELEAIGQEVRSCTRCGLCRTRTNTVLGEGNPDADIVFIGEGPGAEEDKQGRPFVGRAGELLTKMIAAMGLSRDDVYITNVVKCRPPGNRAPLIDEVEACWDYLVRQLKIISPKIIVALGNPATHALLNTTVGITRLRGQWQSLPILDPALAGIKVMPTYHPAFLLRQYTQENRKKVWSDLQKVMKELQLG